MAELNFFGKKEDLSFFPSFHENRIAAIGVRRPRMQKAHETRRLLPSISPRLEARLVSLLGSARGLFSPNPMQGVCLQKDILVGKELTPRHRIACAYHTTPSPYHHHTISFDLIIFFKYGQLSEHPSEDSLFLRLLHIFTVYCTVFHFSQKPPSEMSLLFTDLSWVTQWTKKLPANESSWLTTKFLVLNKSNTAFFLSSRQLLWYRLALTFKSFRCWKSGIY